MIAECINVQSLSKNFAVIEDFKYLFIIISVHFIDQSSGERKEILKSHSTIFVFSIINKNSQVEFSSKVDGVVLEIFVPVPQLVPTCSGAAAQVRELKLKRNNNQKTT